MLMTFKRKNLLTLAFLFFGFIGCVFNISAITHESADERDISYNIEQNGDYNWVVFGPISEWLQQDHRESAGTMGGSSLTRTVVDVCKRYKVNAVRLDDIDYVYDKSSATLTVTGHQGSIYATAQSCVIQGLNFTNVDEIRARRSIINSIISEQMSLELQGEYFRGERGARIEYDKIAEEVRRKNPAPALSIVKPLKYVKFIGNIVMIGENFCNARAGMGGPNVLSQGLVGHFPIEFVDMSQSCIMQICGGAFFECTDLRTVILPQSDFVPKISNEAFEGSPVALSLPISQKYYKDPKKPLSAPGCSCIIL